ncbi:MAG: magnesium chelatase ATPase subunit D [Gemmatimonas sp.]|nr:magnesium chelatase ATPase subunit D [Gemmatimonas sp.]
MRDSASERPAAVASERPTAVATAVATLNLATRAELAAAVLALDGVALGGAVLRAPRSDIAETFVARLRALMPDGAPHRRLPFAIPDDRLLGGLDLAMTLAQGRPVADHGLLAALDGGLLVIPGAERIGASLAARLTQVLDLGHVAQRVRVADAPTHHAARVTIVAIDEAEADEDAVHGAIADRCAFHLLLDVQPLPELYSRADIKAAAALLPHVDADTASEPPAHPTASRSTDAALRTLVHTAELYGIDSLRAVRAALRVARCCAALDGRRSTNDSDVATAAALVLGPRATRLPAPPPETSAEPEPPPPPPDDAQNQDDSAERDDQDVRELEERIIEAMAAALPFGLTMDAPTRTPKARRAAGRAGSDRSGGTRGRQVGTRRGDPRGGGRLDLVETLRAAAPWQPLRRRSAGATEAGSASAKPIPAIPARPRVLVRPDDFRIRRLFEPAGTTAIFVVDASGSSAVNRMAEAKGAVELLLAESYARRDEVALIAFRGAKAEILLPPTRAIAAAKRALAALPGGGGTPLASAIDRAVELTLRARREGNDTVVVFLTDARANVARDGSGGREQAMAEALQSARVMRGLEGQVLLIDTSPRPSPQAQEVAAAMGARYVALPRTDARSIHAAVTAARA